jgi:predicted secreted protein
MAGVVGIRSDKRCENRSVETSDQGGINQMSKKFMKSKVIGVLMVSLVFCMAVGVAEQSLTGTWYLNSIEMEDTGMSPAANGEDIIIVFEEGKTARVIIPGEEDKAVTWSVVDDRVILHSDETGDSAFTLTNSSLFIEQDGVTLVFGKEKPNRGITNLIKSAAIPELASGFEGGEVFFELEENASIGYLWSYVIESEGLLTCTTDAYKPDERSRGADGAGGWQVYVFEANGEGTAMIKLLRTFRGDDDLEITFVIVADETGIQSMYPVE